MCQTSYVFITLGVELYSILHCWTHTPAVVHIYCHVPRQRLLCLRNPSTSFTVKRLSSRDKPTVCHLDGQVHCLNPQRKHTNLTDSIWSLFLLHTNTHTHTLRCLHTHFTFSALTSRTKQLCEFRSRWIMFMECRYALMVKSKGGRKEERKEI